MASEPFTRDERKALAKFLVAVVVVISGLFYLALTPDPMSPGKTMPASTPIAVIYVSTPTHHVVHHSTGQTWPQLRSRWQRVATCESGSTPKHWRWQGPAYPNSIGINLHNWFYFGGARDVVRWVPSKHSYVLGRFPSPFEQVLVGERIEHYLHRPASSIPDVYCGAGY